MRVDVDFNERDRRGHVVARVPAALASQLTVGQRVSLYDPPEAMGRCRCHPHQPGHSHRSVRRGLA
jgi:hypothetical protein